MRPKESLSSFFFPLSLPPALHKKKNEVEKHGIVPPDRPRRGRRGLLRLRHAVPGAHRRQLPVRLRVPARLQGRPEGARGAHRKGARPPRGGEEEATFGSCSSFEGRRRRCRCSGPRRSLWSPEAGPGRARGLAPQEKGRVLRRGRKSDWSSSSSSS